MKKTIVTGGRMTVLKGRHVHIFSMRPAAGSGPGPFFPARPVRMFCWRFLWRWLLVFRDGVAQASALRAFLPGYDESADTLEGAQLARTVAEITWFFHGRREAVLGGFVAAAS